MGRNRFYHRLRILILIGIAVAIVSVAVASYIFDLNKYAFPKPDGDIGRDPGLSQPEKNS